MPSTAADWLYRALYGGVLSRLPEPTALALGQAGLRLLPLDRLGAFRSRDARLAVRLGGVRLGNPLILSSMYYDTAILRRAMGLGFGAVTTKSITRTPRPGHPEPNLVRRWSAEGPGLVNCNGFKNPGLDAYRADLPALPHRTPLIVAVAGETIVNSGNTRRIAEPRLSQGAGGLSGPELFPATLDNLRRTRAKFGESLEIIATGGVDSPDRALALLRAGANACAYFTGFITRGPGLARAILDRLSVELDRAGRASPDELRRC